MEIKISTERILQLLEIISWIIFIGLCVQAGGFIFNIIYTLAYNPNEAHYFWQDTDLSKLYEYDQGYFIVETFLMTIVAIMKALLFYLIVAILHNKKLNIVQPFNTEVGKFLFKMAYLSLFIGLFSFWGADYAKWFVEKGVQMPDIQYLHLGGADVWLFMSVILFVVAHIFKRGIEIQSENELTV